MRGNIVLEAVFSLNRPTHVPHVESLKNRQKHPQIADTLPECPANVMTNFFFQLIAIVLAGVAIAVADVLIKKAAVTGNFWLALKNPLIILAIILYCLQVVFLAYVFVHNWKLGIVGNLQIVFYSITVVLSGMLIFGETLSLVKVAGIGLALLSVFLMNL